MNILAILIWQYYNIYISRIIYDKTDPCWFCVSPHMGSNAQGMVPIQSDDEPLCHSPIPHYDDSGEKKPSLRWERFDS